MIKKIFFIIFLLIVSFFGWLMFLYAQIRFDVDKIVDYKPNLTTRFFDRHGMLLGKIFDKENRLYVKYNQIPPRVIESLVAIEDTNFFEHSGVNIDAIIRAIIKDIKHLKLVEGASTLTQQLVKTMILTRDKKLLRKVKEALLSLRLETLLTKEQILERYLNQVYFGHGYYGIRTASKGYFHKELDQLNLKEIAMLVGLPRAPSFYDPTKKLKYSLSRANSVINRLKKLGWITKEEYKNSIKLIPEVYNDTLSLNKAPYIIDYARKLLKNDIPDLKGGGYDITLTIDYKAQQIAKDGLKYAYNKIKKRDEKYHKNKEKSKTKTLNGAMVVLKNHTGEILALVGGVDYKKSSFNRAVQSYRQPGSSAKPFIYQTALDLGYSTASNLVDIARTYKYNTKSNNIKKWQPKNYEKDYKGLIPLREALVHSRNLATINLVTQLGIDIVYKSLLRYKFTKIPYDLSLTLGSFSVSPLQFSQNYTLFSNNGIIVKPYMIASVKNRAGQTIVFDTIQTYITSSSQTYLMTSILEDVVKRGTGRNAQVKELQTAGKTGTTNKNIDAWFCGYSPSLQTIVWFGNDDNKPMNRSETGGRTAAPAFSYFYKRWLKLHPEIPRVFKKPKGVFEQYFNGKKEVFTQISNIPKKNDIPDIQEKKDDNIIF